MTKVFIHGSGHKGSSWNEVVKIMHNNKDILCPDLSTILNGKEASYSHLYFHLLSTVMKLRDKLIYVDFH